MKNNITLCTLVPGERAVITGMVPGAEERRRFRELGLNDGESVECVLRRGGISAYLVKGTVIALRAGDAGVVCVRPVIAKAVGRKEGCAVWL